MNAGTPRASGEGLVIDPKLEAAAAALRKKTERLMETLPAKKMVGTPVLFRRFRLKRMAKGEREAGLIVEVDVGFTSPTMSALSSEACLHIDQNYDAFDTILTEIVSALQPYAARVSAAEVASAAALKKRGRHARGKGEAAKADAELAAYNIKASALVELYAAIVGDGVGDSYAMRRSSEIVHRLDCSLREWMSWAGVRGDPKGIAEYAAARNAAFVLAHPHPLATAGMAEIVDWVRKGEKKVRGNDHEEA